jgi:hypothetical protein
MVKNINRCSSTAIEAYASVTDLQRARRSLAARHLAVYLTHHDLDRFEVGAALAACRCSLPDLARAMGTLERAGYARFVTGAGSIRFTLASPPPRLVDDASTNVRAARGAA